MLESLPAPVREGLEQAVSFVPRPLLYGGTFRATRSLLARTERMTAEAMNAWQDAQVKDLFAWAYARVPYYRRIGIKPEDIRGAADLVRLPFLTKEILREQHDTLLASGFPESAREQVSTRFRT